MTGLSLLKLLKIPVIWLYYDTVRELVLMAMIVLCPVWQSMTRERTSIQLVVLRCHSFRKYLTDIHWTLIENPTGETTSLMYIVVVNQSKFHDPTFRCLSLRFVISLGVHLKCWRLTIVTDHYTDPHSSVATPFLLFPRMPSRDDIHHQQNWPKSKWSYILPFSSN